MAFIANTDKVGDIVTCPSTGKKGIITGIYHADRYGYPSIAHVVISYTKH